MRGVHTADEFVASGDRIVEATFTEDHWQISSRIVGNVFGAAPRSLPTMPLSNLLDAVLFKLKTSELMDPALRGRKAAIAVITCSRGYLQKLGYDGTRTSTDVNYALVEWNDNIKIRALPRHLIIIPNMPTASTLMS
ncbi:MAG: hypothetical protein R2873_27410 [Caldilineaceae bacterium]